MLSPCNQSIPSVAIFARPKSDPISAECPAAGGGVCAIGISMSRSCRPRTGMPGSGLRHEARVKLLLKLRWSYTYSRAKGVRMSTTARQIWPIQVSIKNLIIVEDAWLQRCLGTRIFMCANEPSKLCLYLPIISSFLSAFNWLSSFQEAVACIADLDVQLLHDAAAPSFRTQAMTRYSSLIHPGWQWLKTSRSTFLQDMYNKGTYAALLSKGTSSLTVLAVTTLFHSQHPGMLLMLL